VPRATTTSDAFNAVAEPRRREILEVLGSDELSVGELVARLGLGQPQVSKHLQVLRQVDLVRSRSLGRQRMYRINGPALKPVHDWVTGFEQTWTDRLDRLERFLEDNQPDSEIQPEEQS
jgi:DNA-binding transcriptional ArsR family regulator